MKVWKIRRDAGPEDLTWKPPNLCFTMERHGWAAMGSTRAERQTWTLNLEALTAIPNETGYRQLQPNSPRLDVTPIVKDICEAVQGGPASTSDLTERGTVKWVSNDEIRLQHGDLIPNDGPKDTASGRRKRLRENCKVKWKALG